MIRDILQRIWRVFSAIFAFFEKGRYEYDVGPRWLMISTIPKQQAFCFKEWAKSMKNVKVGHVHIVIKTDEERSNLRLQRYAAQWGNYRFHLVGRSNLSVPDTLTIRLTGDGSQQQRQVFSWQSVRFKLQIGLMKSSPKHLAISPTSHSPSRVP